jgi:hypothetical protein
MKCYFCNQPITGPVHYHHPDKRRFPTWLEPAHPQCHKRYHQDAGHFKQWGREGGLKGGIPQRFRGRPGYELCIAKWPGFHRMGGLARARSAQRDKRGRFR